MTQPNRDVVIVGAGAFGAAAAGELARRGWTVSLVDRPPLPHPDASSTDVSKMVRMDYGSDVFYHELAEASLDQWERWNTDMARPLYHGEGFLVLSVEPMESRGFEHESFEVLERRGYRPERVDREAMRRRYPKWNAGRYPDGYFSTRGGWAESGAVVAWLLASARRAGVRFIEGRVLEVETSGAHATGVRIRSESGSEQTVNGTEVVVCAGAWTPGLVPSTAQLLTPVAQPVLHFGVSDPDEYRGSAFPPFAADIAGSGWYGFPALGDGRLKLGHHGPGVPRAPDARGSVTDDHVAAARAFFAESIPSLVDAPVVGQRVCMYCDSHDGDLLIDRPPHLDGLVVAAGGSGHAFKFIPLLGGIIADAVEGKQNRWLARFAWRSPTVSRSEEARYLMTKGREP